LVTKQLDLEELWVECSNGVHLRELPIHEYASKLEGEVCKVSPLWFAFTGCDTVSGFRGRGKKMTRNTLQSHHPVLIHLQGSFIKFHQMVTESKL